MNVHGNKGVYCAGDWVPIEECAKAWNAPQATSECGGNCSSCPQNATKDANVFDVAIIGAGCIGSCIARELAKYKLSVVVIDQEDDVTQGATKGNSGIVHAGYDDKPGSVRSRFCWKGNQMFASLDRQLHFGFQRNGSLVVAFTPEDREMLHELMERGHANGVANLRIIERKELLEMEPSVNKDAIAALYSPDAGTVTPYEFTIAVAENAADNGVQFRLSSQVVGIDRVDEQYSIRTVVPVHRGPSVPSILGFVALMLACAVAGSGTSRVPAWVPVFLLVTCVLMCGLAFVVRGPGRMAGASVRARYVVNAAGLGSDKISQMAGAETFQIKPRHGEYLLFHKNQGQLARHVLFPTPGKMGKGVLVQPTLWGNLLLGPTARDQHDSVASKMRPEAILRFIMQKCSKLVPGFDPGEIIHSFSGARAKNSRGDWIIEASAMAPNFVHAAGIDSPGLAASPAIAMEVVSLLRGCGLVCEENTCFNPHRAPIIVPKNGWNGIKVNHEDPARNVVCKCEKVTEAEICDAIHRSLPVSSTQAVRKRTRAGMGHCQGEFCEPRVTTIIARETKIGEGEVGRRPWPASSLMPRRWLTDDDKLRLSSFKPKA